MLVKDFKSLFKDMNDNDEIRFTCGGDLSVQDMTISTVEVPEFIHKKWWLKFVPVCVDCKTGEKLCPDCIANKACCYCGRVFHDGDTILQNDERYYK